MEERFSKHCKVVERLSHLEPLRLKHVQHLQSRLQGRLLDEVTDAQLLSSYIQHLLYVDCLNSIQVSNQQLGII